METDWEIESKSMNMTIKGLLKNKTWVGSFLLGVALFAQAGFSVSEAPADLLKQWASEAETMTVEGRDGWLFLDRELSHLASGIFWGDRALEVSRSGNPDFADPLPAILDFHRQLKELGVHLVLMPVPAKAVIHTQYLPSPLSGEQREAILEPQRDFFEKLRQEGVDVLDLTTVFLEAEHSKGPVFCQQDTHWSGVGTVLAAEHLKEHLRGLGKLPSGGETWEARWEEFEMNGDLRQALPEPSTEAETLSLRFVRDSAGENMEARRESPVTLLGDSHNLVFHAGGDLHTRGAGFPDQVAYVLGVAPDVVGVRGSGATPARINLFRRAQRDPDYWSGKEVVVWTFAVREFTQAEGGWRPLPVSP